ncbi:hypothetical protein [Mycetocola spongiae]|uniref:hypothetical protein n=1 Tax=Mycetocola spongiae TaxID=2859226 RepID=UPI001CF1AF43|nr:hypothetical protein [Mycetocola spongiae]UCR90369.1 hypothetical protein KXZ72_06910 [Mycetocola spongiae]
MSELTGTRPALRRIVVRDAKNRHDLVIPLGNTLAHALAVLGTDPHAGDRVLGPSGVEVGVHTLAADLREGGLYTLTGAGSRAQPRGRGRTPGGAAARGAGIGPWWPLLGCGLLLAGLSGFSATAVLPAALLLIFAGLFGAIFAVLRDDARDLLPGRALPLGASFFVPPALAALGTALLIPPAITGAGQLAVAAGAGAAALICSLITVLSTRRPQRAAAGTLVVFLTAIAVVWAGSILIGWTLPQIAMISAGCVPLLLRALPSMFIEVDEGYSIDFGRFMTARWTVRGRVPAYRPTVDDAEVREIVQAASARLQAATILLSLLVALCLPAVVGALAAPGAILRWAGLAETILVPLALLLGSRRATTAILRHPPRIAVLLALPVIALLAAPALTELGGLALAGGLLLAATIAAAIILPVARGGRSLGLSRTGDILDSFTLAFAPMAALLAADTLTLMQGMFSG